MLPPTFLLLLLPLLLLLLLIRRLVSPATTNKSLAAMPAAHPLAPYTSAWITYVRWRGREIATIHAAHARLGGVVRLAPMEVSVNCVEGGLKEVYAGGRYGKSVWYAFFANYSNVPPMFAIVDSKPHTARKRLLSGIYSKSSVQASASLRHAVSQIVYQRLLPQLSSAAAAAAAASSSSSSSASNAHHHVDMYSLLSALTMDIVTAYIFSLPLATNFTQDKDSRDAFLHWYNCRRSFTVYHQEMPRLTGWLERIGIRLVPRWVDEANGNIEAMVWDLCEGARKWVEGVRATEGAAELEKRRTEGEWPVVYDGLVRALIKEQEKDDAMKREVASELLDHLAAGFDTSSITLTYLAHELSQHPLLQARLRAELRQLSPPMTPASAPSLPSPKALDAAPLLHAVVMETLRLHAAIPGPQPRVTPAGGASLGQYANLPAGVRVASQAWSLHRNAEVFPQPEQWLPERWLDADGNLLTADGTDGGGGEGFRDMMRWFWAFGSGGRMCIGSHLAVYQIKCIVAAIYSNYETRVVDDSGMEQQDSYTAPPKGERPLIVRVERVE
ncbi:cytochrome P450 monooxygenase-like protein [Phyllosticta citriasiana]|uniref:Cytochrome P450 monooxygenase-like protein n=1 Tax=Phyllosticta citriasiana TaxID=595635 RepID=A0ABR1KPW4_9PEZI